MSKLYVDRQLLISTAQEIDNYVLKLEDEIGRADSEMHTLTNEWKGADCDQVMKEWNEMTEKGSTADATITAFKNYAAELRKAEGLYCELQERAISRATKYCR